MNNMQIPEHHCSHVLKNSRSDTANTVSCVGCLHIILKKAIGNPFVRNGGLGRIVFAYFKFTPICANVC